MPITKQITETKTRTVVLMTLQEYADQCVAEEYRQPLKDIHGALAVHGWDANPFPEDYRPQCCGQPISIYSFLGDPYHGECKTCGKFIHAIDGPSFGNSYVTLMDSEKVDMDTEFRWIAGIDIARQGE
jgi:hypothetical protein